MEARGRRALGVRWDRRASMRRAGAACARRGVAPGRPVRDEAGRGNTHRAALLERERRVPARDGGVLEVHVAPVLPARVGSFGARSVSHLATGRIVRGAAREGIPACVAQPQPPRDGRAPPDDELLVGDVEGASDLAPRAELNQLTHDAGHRVCRVCAAPLPGRCVEWRPSDVSDRLCRPRRSSRGGRGGATARSDSCWWLLYGAPVRIRDATSHEPWIRANSRPAARASALDRS